MKLPSQIIVQLIHIHGSLKGEIQEFTDPVITIGRLPSSSVHFQNNEQDLMVSRNHASIQKEGNQFKLTDLSKFGTFVNGKQLKETFLKNGDVLEFGPGGPKISFQMEILEGVAEPVKPLVRQMEQQAVSAVEPKPPVSSFEPPIIESPATVPLQNAPSLEERAPRFEPKVQEAIPIRKVPVSLVIQFGPTIRSYKELPVVLGANPGCDFVITHEGICDQHAQLFYSLESFWIKDLTGQNLIRINQNRIDFQSQLKPMDEIRFSPHGPTLKFLGDGRFSEVEEINEEPQQTGNSHDSDDKSSVRQSNEGEGNFFSRFMKGFKK